jgi:transcriptional regulator NrdR family protein
MVETNISYYPISLSYCVNFSIGGKTISKNFETLEESQSFKKELLKKRNLLKKVNPPKISKNYKIYNKKHIKTTTIEKSIYKVENSKTKYISYSVVISFKGKIITKRFGTIEEARIFRDIILKERDGKL